ncbi:MAG: crossover junction endodeoxyribonuclease RuvC [Candidatus Manganitrophaceae bacterium]|nr:MAG: crossover junction endodeoxyribonuclease RuvC [Candidatus Manganitrophaceae bacterium]
MPILGPILGIDPGMGVTGYAILEEASAGRLILKRSGEVRTTPQHSFPKRLKHLFDGLLQVIQEELPIALAIEDTFLAKNFKSALKLGQARGVALLAAEFHQIPVFEYTPTAVKMAVVGYGGATKEQIQQMTGRLLQLSTLLASEHAADAAAVAICHIHSAQFHSKIEAAEKIGRTRSNLGLDER